MKRVTLYLTDQEIVGLQQASRETGLKFAELMRRLIDEWLATRARQRRSGKD